MAFAPAQGFIASGLASGSPVGGLGSTLIAYGDAAGAITSEAAFAYNATTNKLSVDNIAVGTGTSLAPSLSDATGTYGICFINSRVNFISDVIDYIHDTNNFTGLRWDVSSGASGGSNQMTAPTAFTNAGGADCKFMSWGATFTSSAGTGVAELFRLAPIFNLTTGSSTGPAKAIYIKPTITALNAPSGANNINGAVILASTAALGSTSGLGGIVMFNTSNETSARENSRMYWASNELTIATENNGASARGISFVTADDATAQILLKHSSTSTIAGGVTDGYTGGLRLTPTYSAATAQTVTRHNYIDVNDVTLAGAGPAALTDACVMRFNAAAGTHKAVDSGTTKTSPGTVTQWIKVNVNGTIAYIPSYSSKTS